MKTIYLKHFILFRSIESNKEDATNSQTLEHHFYMRKLHSI